jgi:Zn-dependent protease
MTMSPDIFQVLTYFLAMLISLTIHEAAHALVAFMRGDPTAKNLGRLTLNPFAHSELFGTFILPLLGAFMHLPIIGWAKPVPVDLRNVRNPKWDNILIAAAGPLANLVLCFLCVAALAVHSRFLTESLPPESFFYPLLQLTTALVWVNAFLAVFNLLPLPPLDGATVVGAVLPYKWAQGYDSYVRPYGFFMLMMLIVAGGLHWVPTWAGYYVGLVEKVLGMVF